MVAFSLLLNLGILFHFKYSNFLLQLLADGLGLFGIALRLPPFDILLPVGISFYTFQALGYTVDVYRGASPPEKNFLRYALFVAFFPQLVAGPIERCRNLLPQFIKDHPFDYASVRLGLLWMLWGFFLKTVISDRCAVVVNQVYGHYLDYRGFQLIYATFLFTIQIYCDFRGYSLIAKGAAKVLGYDLMDNFARPYLATSLKAFWRRWHISLSTWLKDYLYIPLGGNRCSQARRYCNLLLTFLLSGLWHGAAVTFIAWGGVHGLYLIAEDFLGKRAGTFCAKLKINRQASSWHFFLVVKNFLLVSAAWVFFRAQSLGAACSILGRSLSLGNTGLLLNGGLYRLGLNERHTSLLFIGLAVLLVSSLLEERGVCLSHWLAQQNLCFRYLVYWAAVVLLIFSMDITGQEFLYFQF